MLDGKIPRVEDPQADIPLQRAAEVDHRLVPQPEPVPLLVGNDFRLFGGVELQVEHDLRGIARPSAGAHDPLKLQVVLGERLKLVDGGVQSGLELIARFHLVGDGPQVRLEVGDRLAGADQLVDLASEEGRQLDDLVGLGGTLSLLDGDVRGAAVAEELGDLLLGLPSGLAGFGDPLPEDSGV